MNNIFVGWIVIAVVLFLIELATPSTFFFSCLGLAAVLSAFTGTFVSQSAAWGVFFAASVVFVVLSRPLVKKLDKRPSRRTNIDALVGEKGMVTETVDPSDERGMVKVKGEVWRAKSEKRIESGKEVTVTKVEGNYLIVS